MQPHIVGTILLYCNSGRSNKEFLIDICTDWSGSIIPVTSILTSHGPAGKLRRGKNYGSYNLSNLNKLLSSKIAKSYEIISVNGKPFTSGSIQDAQRLIENGNDWNQLKTAQPVPILKPMEVLVTFDIGQLAPIW